MKTPLYLPITRVAVRDFVDDGEIPEDPSKRAALVAMYLFLNTERPTEHDFESMLLGACRICADHADTDVAELLQHERERRTGIRGSEIEVTLNSDGIFFASEKAVDSWYSHAVSYSSDFQSWCRDTMMDFCLPVQHSPGGCVDDEEPIELESYNAPETRYIRTTTDQARVAGAIVNNRGEHFRLDAYAGCGKTHLLLELSASIGNCAHLAPSKAHQYAFNRLGGLRGIESHTQFELAQRMLSDHQRTSGALRTGLHKIGNHGQDRERQARVAGIRAVGASSPAAVLSRIYTAISKWCYSGRPVLGIDDFPWSIPMAERVVYLGYACGVWELMFNMEGAKAGSPFPIKAYHAVKRLDLAGAQIPNMGTILVDEAHDLSQPWMSLLARYPGGWVLMGDPYQRLDGRLNRVPRGHSMEMVQSVRAGEHAMRIIDPVLGLHSSRLMLSDIRGSRDTITSVSEYQENEATPTDGLFVYGSEWHMLRDGLRLKRAGTRFQFIPASGSFLLRASFDAINLHKHGDVPVQYHLSRFGTWDKLADYLCRAGLDNVARLFEKGYSIDNAWDLNREGNTVGDVHSDKGIKLGLLQHCKNLEAPTVIMKPCCFEQPMGLSRERDRAVREVYLALTRARDGIFYPAGAVDALAKIVADGSGTL